MPPLSGDENIRDFIACTAHGMLIDAISGTDAARLLYAAQVAHTTRRHLPEYSKPANGHPPGGGGGSPYLPHFSLQ
jgi:hypothetical protein